MDIVEKLLYLQKQATLEENHFYSAEGFTEAIQEITLLRNRIKEVYNVGRSDGCTHCGRKDVIIKKLRKEKETEWKD